MAFGGVPAGLILEIAKAEGYMQQLTLFDEYSDIFPPMIEINEKYLNFIPMGYKWNDTGSTYHRDHPAFAELRDRLEKDGYIKTERTYVNGDMVTKPFYLNNKLFDVGDRFLSAGALGVNFRVDKQREKRDNAKPVLDAF